MEIPGVKEREKNPAVPSQLSAAQSFLFGCNKGKAAYSSVVCNTGKAGVHSSHMSEPKSMPSQGENIRRFSSTSLAGRSPRCNFGIL